MRGGSYGTARDDFGFDGHCDGHHQHRPDRLGFDRSSPRPQWRLEPLVFALLQRQELRRQQPQEPHRLPPARDRAEGQAGAEVPAEALLQVRPQVRAEGQRQEPAVPAEPRAEAIADAEAGRRQRPVQGAACPPAERGAEADADQGTEADGGPEVPALHSAPLEERLLLGGGGRHRLHYDPRVLLRPLGRIRGRGGSRLRSRALSAVARLPRRGRERRSHLQAF